MSFGFSVGDIIKLVEITTHTYDRWKNACGTYATVTNDLAVLRTLLSRMEVEAKMPNSLISSNDINLQHWRSLSKDCRKVVRDLASILDKYRSLSTSRAKNWDRIRLDNKKLAALEARLSRKIDGITAFAVVIGISSQGRLERVVIPELQRKMDAIAAEVRKGNRSICTISAHEDDDKVVWRDFRREMIRAGVKSGDIHKYAPALKTYLLRMTHSGLLDEEEIPQSSQDEPSEDLAQEEILESSTQEEAFRSPPHEGTLESPPQENLAIEQPSYLLQSKREGLPYKEERTQSPQEEVLEESSQGKTAIEGQPSSTNVSAIDLQIKEPIIPLSDDSQSCKLNSDGPKISHSTPKQDPKKTLAISSNGDKCYTIESTVLDTNRKQRYSPSLQIRPDAVQRARKDFEYVEISPNIISALKDNKGMSKLQGILVYGFWCKHDHKDFILHSFRWDTRLRKEFACRFLEKISQMGVEKVKNLHRLAVLPASQVSSQLLGRFKSTWLIETPYCRMSFLQSVDEFIGSDTDIYILAERYIAGHRSFYFATSRCVSEYLSGPSDENFHSYANRIIDGANSQD